MSEIKQGTKHEAEHLKTMKQIAADSKSGKLKPWKEYQKGIAKEHLKEISDYYTRLSNMEKEAKGMQKAVNSMGLDMMKAWKPETNPHKIAMNKHITAARKLIDPKHSWKEKGPGKTKLSGSAYTASPFHKNQKILPGKESEHAQHKVAYEKHLGDYNKSLSVKKPKAPMIKAIDCIDNALDLLKGGEGSKGGRIIGHTKSGKPIYENSHKMANKGWTEREHDEAGAHHFQIFSDKIGEAVRLGKEGKTKEAKNAHNVANHHEDAMQYHYKKGSFGKNSKVNKQIRGE
jgi:hypothetical protein